MSTHYLVLIMHTGQKMKFSIKDFFNKCDQIRRKLRIWSHLLKKFLIGNFIFCAMAIDISYFPTALKQANITPVFKTEERCSKDNYRPISILPNVSKIFEKCMFPQMSHYMDNFLSKH